MAFDITPLRDPPTFARFHPHPDTVITVPIRVVYIVLLAALIDWRSIGFVVTKLGLQSFSKRIGLVDEVDLDAEIEKKFPDQHRLR